MHTKRIGTMRALVVLLTIGGLAPAVPGAEVPFSAGAGEVDLTPDAQMINARVKKPFAEIHDPIGVRALVLGDGASRLALVVWELIDTPEVLVARVRAEVEKTTGIPKSQVLINATHTHSAPLTMPYSQAATGVENDPIHRAWAEALPQRCAEAVRLADAARRPATLQIGRSYAGEWVFNRRPIRPDGTVQSLLQPPDPHSLANGMRFGKTEPTLTVLQFRDAGDKAIATLFHLPCHSVAVYNRPPPSPYSNGISADWSAPVRRKLKETFGAPAIFVQGCAGDIVPARRGFEAVAEMGKGVSARALSAIKNSVRLPTGLIRHTSAVVGLPLTALAREESGGDAAMVPAEIHMIAIGPLAIVMMPGEPLSQLGFSIQERSPYEHTLVLGYSNGRGAGYVGMPGDKAKGGYEMTRVGRATDEAGGLMIETAVRLLQEKGMPSLPGVDNRRS